MNDRDFKWDLDDKLIYKGVKLFMLKTNKLL